jgi:gamma-glutamylcyclotransferase (GGCT)/AIG2-like uncharacterized protein YtfP
MLTDLATTASDLLFVYGSLRRESSHHHILRSIRAGFMGPAMVAGQLFDLGRFPGARLVEPSDRIGSRRVMGELYRLRNPEHDFDVLDRYEGLQSATPKMSLFGRELTRAWTRGGNTAQAWIYCLNRNPPKARPIPSGDYSKVNQRPCRRFANATVGTGFQHALAG